MTITHTYVKTFALYDPWAETLPWDCLIRQTSCCAGPEHRHSPMVGDTCAEPQCDEPLLAGEVCYGVIGIDRQPGDLGEPWVCWRHVRPDAGPVTVARSW